MVRQFNPRKDQKGNQNESNEFSLKTKRKEKKEKYRHKNSWLEEEEDYNFDDELDSDYLNDDEEENS